MLNLNFSPYYTTIKSEELDASAVSTGEDDEELIVIRSTDDHIFYIADTDRFSKIIDSLETDKDARMKLSNENTRLRPV